MRWRAICWLVWPSIMGVVYDILNDEIRGILVYYSVRTPFWISRTAIAGVLECMGHVAPVRSPGCAFCFSCLVWLDCCALRHGRKLKHRAARAGRRSSILSLVCFECDAWQFGKIAYIREIRLRMISCRAVATFYSAMQKKKHSLSLSLRSGWSIHVKLIFFFETLSGD